jgi:signal transduction histidine kinase
MEIIDLDPEIKEIIKTVQEQHPKTEFTYTGAGAFPVKTNKSLAGQVFLNIISNAAEYSNAFSGRVIISLKKEDRVYHFSCEDNGIGIPPKDQSNIFSPLFRASNAKHIKKEGTGLGLFIAKIIGDRFGWKISFRSKVGKGTTFFVTIPSYGAVS